MWPDVPAARKKVDDHCKCICSGKGAQCISTLSLEHDIVKTTMVNFQTERYTSPLHADYETRLVIHLEPQTGRGCTHRLSGAAAEQASHVVHAVLGAGRVCRRGRPRRAATEPREHGPLCNIELPNSDTRVCDTPHRITTRVRSYKLTERSERHQ